MSQNITALGLILSSNSLFQQALASTHNNVANLIPNAILPQVIPTRNHPEVINLNISPDYCANNSAWGQDASLRELIQNWRDQIVKVIGEDWKAKTVVKDFFRCYYATNPRESAVGGFILEIGQSPNSPVLIYLVNYATQLPDSALIMGASSKVGNNRMAGAHGEGMKVGINRLVSSGVQVGVLTNREDWVFTHRSGALHLVRDRLNPTLPHPFSPMQNSTTCFVVAGFPHTMRVEHYLFLGYPLIAEEQDTYYFKTNAGELRIFLNHPELTGKVFVKGIFVEDKQELRFTSDKGGIGVDILSGVALDRDRSRVSIDDLTKQILPIFDTVRPVHGLQAKDQRLLEAFYEELKGLQARDNSIISRLVTLQSVRSTKGFSECMYYIFLRAHGISPDEDAKSQLPMILPLADAVGEEDVQEYQYFLGLPQDKIIRCKDALLNVLYEHKRPQKVEHYIYMFWDKVLSLDDYEFSEGGHESFLAWIEQQINNTFKGILEMNQFYFKIFPEHQGSRKTPVRVISFIGASGKTQQYVVVDCVVLFASCTCPSAQTEGVCHNSCVQSAFLSSLKSSLFRRADHLRTKHEEQLQAYLIKITSPNKPQGDRVLPSRKPLVSAGNKATIQSHGSSSAVQANATGTFSGSGRGYSTAPVSTHQLLSHFTTATSHQGRHTHDTTSAPYVYKEIELFSYFPTVKAPMPFQFEGSLSARSGKQVVSDYGCEDISLNYCTEHDGISIYFDPKSIDQTGIQRYTRELNGCVQTIKFIFSKIGQQSTLSQCAVFVSPMRTELYAFNRKGQMFFNALAAQAISLLNASKAIEFQLFWFVVICHEAAHNLHEGHGKDHESAEEHLIVHLLPRFL